MEPVGEKTFVFWLEKVLTDRNRGVEEPITVRVTVLGMRTEYRNKMGEHSTVVRVIFSNSCQIPEVFLCEPLVDMANLPTNLKE